MGLAVVAAEEDGLGCLGASNFGAISYRKIIAPNPCSYLPRRPLVRSFANWSIVSREDTVGTLCFVCPTSGREVDTGIDVDPQSFGGLRGEQLGCPDCLEVHQLSQIKAWVADVPTAPAE